MDKLTQKSTWMVAGAALAVLSGLPAVADDTDLLLLKPNIANNVTPNVMLIIDSSGSMRTEEETREVYDSDEVYPDGDVPCSSDHLYWTEYRGVTPSCEDANTQRIRKDAFVCDHATRQLDGLGIYNGIMAQFRDGGSGFFSVILGLDAVRWQKLEAGNETDLVECAKDSGEHGATDGNGAVYAQKGGDVAAFTDDPDAEAPWGNWPTSQSVTVYDGNYLNYLQNPELVDRQRIDIVKDTAEAILTSIEGVNVGVMRFNGDDGGHVIQAMTDLDTNRDDIVAAINAIAEDGNTPLSETLYESALYWRGMAANYGALTDDTDPDALATTDPDVYQQPASQACAKNFNVLLTDGLPRQDFDTPNLVGNLPDWATVLGYSGCTGAEQGDCLDDIAEYLYTNDISTEPGVQTVTTHTIGFAIDLDILEEAASRGGGSYFLADDVQSLTLALLEIVSDITDRSLSFAAPAVAVNTFNRTQNLNDLYLTTFGASEQYRWPGNVKKYRIENSVIVDRNGNPAVNPENGLFYDTARSFWSSTADGNDVLQGGAVENMPTPDNRNLFTNISVDNNLAATSNALSVGNVGAFELSDFGLTGSAEEPTIEQVIRWARGEDVLDEDLDPDTTIRRFMGDPLHSQPAAVSYGGTPENPDLVVFAATNDGYVHAIDASNGRELWAFIPREHLPRLPNLYFNPDSAFKTYGVDGDIVPVTMDRDGDGVIEAIDDDFVILIFGMRRGGDSYYALDVTDKDRPELLWRVSAPEFGQTWSRPTIARVDIANSNINDDKAVVIIGGGYDAVHDTMAFPAENEPDTQGAGIMFLDLKSGEILWRAGNDTNADLEMPDLKRAIPGQISVIDLNGDRFADRMYAADLGGQLLRFDIFNGRPADGEGNNALVTGGVLAQLGAEGNTVGFPDTRRFYTSPDVSIFNDNAQNRRFLAVSIGSGYRPGPLDNVNIDRFYSIRDRNVFTQLTQAQYNSQTLIRDGDLVEISGTIGTVIGQDQAGWRFTLPANQKVLSNSVTFNNEIFFVAFSPDNEGASTCSAGAGRNFLYRVSVVNGDPIGDLDGIVQGEEDAARVTNLAQGGIAPSPRFLFPSPDPDCEGEDCSPPPLGCVGVECFDPGFQNFPVRTLWTQDGIE